jgi:hypothetical protein
MTGVQPENQHRAAAVAKQTRRRVENGVRSVARTSGSHTRPLRLGFATAAVRLRGQGCSLSTAAASLKLAISGKSEDGAKAEQERRHNCAPLLQS